MSALRTVAALYIDPRGPYPSMPDVDAWDVSRDARLYDGPHVVVAHPPCGPWSHLSHLYKGDEADCGPRAVGQVRGFGGVLEHPAHSQLWKHMGLPKPGESDFYGRCFEVSQCDFGHPARKRTWLYVVTKNGRHGPLPATPPPREPTHWASGSRTAKRGPVPAGIKVCSAAQRRRTPPAFAAWLVGLARSVQP